MNLWVPFDKLRAQTLKAQGTDSLKLTARFLKLKETPSVSRLKCIH